MLVVQALGVKGEAIFDSLLDTINEAITDEIDWSLPMRKELY